MVRRLINITEQQERDIKLLAKRKKKSEAKVIRDLLIIGLNASRSTPPRESTGESLLRLASIGKKLRVKGVKAPSDLSSRIDDYLYGKE
jgi:hypothetical protein